MPPPASPVDWEVTFVLPLGALANQLVKIEGNLRFLAMKAAEHLDEVGVRSRAVDVRVELIQQTLASIDALMSRLQADIHPCKPAPEQDD